MTGQRAQREGAGASPRPGDTERQPKPEVLAEPTYWPLVLAAGITLLAWGVVTSYVLSVLGGGMTTVAVIKWIADIRREQQRAGSN